jgi:hypothetical protein
MLHAGSGGAHATCEKVEAVCRGVIASCGAPDGFFVRASLRLERAAVVHVPNL